VEEHQIDAEPFVVDAEPLLASDEGEIIAEFQQERLQVVDQRLFEVALGIFVLEM
jgi:hypothetical protein